MLRPLRGLDVARLGSCLAKQPILLHPACGLRTRARCLKASRKRSCSALDHGDEVFLAHHEQLFAVDLHFGAGVLAEQHFVAGLDR